MPAQKTADDRVGQGIKEKQMFQSGILVEYDGVCVCVQHTLSFLLCFVWPLLMTEPEQLPLQMQNVQNNCRGDWHYSGGGSNMLERCTSAIC